MKAGKFFALLAVLLAGTALLVAQGFKAYPGAKMEEAYTKASNDLLRQAGQTDRTATIYTTNDAFEKVVAFYKPLGKEYQMPGRAGESKKLPSGQELKEAFFILDGAKDLGTSKLWIKVQRPSIGMARKVGTEIEYEEVRDITAIIVSEKK